MQKTQPPVPINIDNIVVEKSPFYLGSDRVASMESLKDSIRQWGFQTPVILRPGKNKPVLVHGFRRVVAARRISKTVPAIITIETDPVALLKRTLSENTASRGLTLYEKCLAFRAFGRFGVSDAAVLNDILPLFGWPGQKTIFRQVQSLSKINPDILFFLSAKNCPLKKTYAFTLLGEAGEKIFLSLIRQFKPGLNEFELLARYLVEAARRQNTAPAQLLAKILRRKSSETSWSHLMGQLFQYRYPKLSERHNKIRSVVARMGLPPSIKIRWDETLEHAGFRLEADIRAPADWTAALNHIARPEQNQLIRALLLELDTDASSD